MGGYPSVVAMNCWRIQ